MLHVIFFQIKPLTNQLFHPTLHGNNNGLFGIFQGLSAVQCININCGNW